MAKSNEQNTRQKTQDSSRHRKKGFYMQYVVRRRKTTKLDDPLIDNGHYNQKLTRL